MLYAFEPLILQDLSIQLKTVIPKHLIVGSMTQFVNDSAYILHIDMHTLFLYMNRSHQTNIYFIM
jgi:hypothetical protein